MRIKYKTIMQNWRMLFGRSYYHTKDQSDSFRVWRVIILLLRAKCYSPPRVEHRYHSEGEAFGN